MARTKGTLALRVSTLMELSDLILERLAAESGQLPIDVCTETCNQAGLDKLARETVFSNVVRRLSAKGDHHYLVTEGRIAWHSARAKAASEYGLVVKPPTVAGSTEVAVVKPAYELAREASRSAQERRHLTVFADKMTAIARRNTELEVHQATTAVSDVVHEKDFEIRRLQERLDERDAHIRFLERLAIAQAGTKRGADDDDAHDQPGASRRN